MTNKSQKVWSHIGLFMVVLVLSMPINAASGLAATVQITHNTGEAGIPGYIDATGDTWTIRALITGLNGETVTPEDVTLKIGSKQTNFETCGDGINGIECEYISPLTEGIKEGEYNFDVIYDSIDPNNDAPPTSNGDVIKADGNGPIVTEFSASQENGKINIDFRIIDATNEANGVGLETIEIIDADTGEVVQTITGFEGIVQQYKYSEDTNYDGTLQFQYSEEGQKRLRVRAKDRLGHVTPNPPLRNIGIDFVAPEIVGSLNFTDIGKFIGEYNTKSDLVVQIKDNDQPKVSATSELITFKDESASCSDSEGDAIWDCVWQDVEIKPVSSVSVLIKAEDNDGNTAEKTLSQSFTEDKSPPKIETFGSERVYENEHFVGGDFQRIIARIKEQGAGIDNKTGVRADLQALGGSANEPPTEECVTEGSFMECFWETTKNLADGGQVEIGLARVEDNVGNEPVLPRKVLNIDNSGPKVEKIEIYGVGGTSEQPYIQSGDQIKVKLTITESTGLVMLVDMDELAPEADTKYPMDTLSRLVDQDGWQGFTHVENCEIADEDKWTCTIETGPIMSGPATVPFEIKIFDTAGNEATWEGANNKDLPKHDKGSKKDGSYTIDILGSETEDSPEYWEVGKVNPLGGDSSFVDIETTHLTYTRFPVEIDLNPVNPSARAINIELISCAPDMGNGLTPLAPQAFNAGDSQLAPAEEGAENPAEKPEEEEAKPAAPLTGSAIDLGEDPAAAAIPPLARTLLLKGVDATGDKNPRPKIILEFEPFDGRKLFGISEESLFDQGVVDYKCNFKIYSKIKKKAISKAEIQEVIIPVKFAFSELGAQDENLQEIIDREREAASTGFWGVIGVLNDVFKWVDYLVQVYNIVVSVINVVSAGMNGVEAAYATPVTKGGGVAACFGMSGTQGALGATGTVLDPILEVLSCRPQGKGSTGWYGTWQNLILDFYNIEILKPIGEDAGGAYRPGRDIKQNLYLSILGLCLPGIIQNVEKYRQIKCRKVICLEQEVASGLADIGVDGGPKVNQCNELEGLLTCKYFLGELWYALPFVNLWDKIINALSEALKDPLATLHTATLLGCGISCVVSSTLASSCTYIYYIWDIIGVIENTAGFVTTMIAEFGDGGLNYCDSVGL